MKGAAILIHCSLMPIRNDLHVIKNVSNKNLDIIAVRAEGILFINVYLHASSATTNPRDEMHDVLMEKLLEIEGFITPSQPVILGGDFNYPKLAESLKRHMQAVGLTQACDDNYTFKRVEKDDVVYQSKLDWLFTRNVPTFNYQVDVKETDHDIIRTSFKIPQEGRSKARKYNYGRGRKMEEEERERFNLEIETAATAAKNISDFYQKLQEIVERYLGHQASSKPHALFEYMKQEVKRASKKLLQLVRMYRAADEGSENKRELKKQVQEARRNRNRAVRSTVRQRRRQIGQRVDLGLGKIIKEYIHSRKGGELHHQAGLLENPREMIDFWRAVFHDEQALHNHIDKMLAGAEDDDEEPDAGVWKRNGGTMKITAEDVEQAIAEMKNKTPAEDDIRLHLFQSCSLKTLEQLARLYTVMGESMKVPLWMKGGIGRVIHKSGARSNPSNYRIILLAPLLGKIYDKILDMKLKKLQEHEYVEKIWEEQYGFMAGRQTHDPVFIVNSIRDGRKREKAYMVLAFMDLKKAFDSVSHRKLLQVLSDQGAPDDFLNMLAPLLDCRHMELCGEKVVFMKGTPQGSPISPLLFLFFINPLLKRLREECVGLPFTDKLYYTSLAFADDLVLIPNDNRELAKMLRICKEWADEYGMSFNIEKSKLMVCEGNPDEMDIDVKQLPMELELVDEFKYLGVMIYGKPKAGRPRQNQPIRKDKMWAAVYRVRFALKPHYDIPLLKQIELINTYVLSQVMYPTPVSALDYKPIDIFINQQLRKITGLDSRCSITMLRNELGLLDCKSDANKRSLVFLWHLMNETSFKHALGELRGSGPYMRLINLAKVMGIDPIKTQILSKEEWKGVVNRAIRSKAQQEKFKAAKTKGVPPPDDQLQPRRYVKMGGGLAKYGVQFRWNTHQKEYQKLKESRMGERQEEEKEEENLLVPEAPCNQCGCKHGQGSTSVEDLARCRKACDNRRIRRKRRRALCAVGEEILGRPCKRVPKCATSIFPSLEWKNQSKETTRQVLSLLKDLLKETKRNASVRSRVNRLVAVTSNVFQSLPRPLS